MLGCLQVPHLFWLGVSGRLQALTLLYVFGIVGAVTESRKLF